MSHRALPTRAETLHVMRHLADVASLKGDPAAQRQLLADGMAGWCNATMAWAMVVDGWRPGGTPPRPAGASIDAATDGVCRRYITDLAAAVPADADPYADRSLADPAAEQHYTMRQVLPDVAAHRRYALAAEVVSAGRIGDGAVGLFRTGPDGDRVVGLSWHRCRGDGRMTARDHAIQRFVIAEVRRLVDRGHLSLADPVPTRPPLSPRPAQVLQCLLAGRSPKAIATHLGLSLWTVRDYVQQVYAHHDVQGRDELMARFIRRGDGFHHGDTEARR